MDNFPDELLLDIFSRLQDGVTLLDGVRLVCRRWCALSRDPRAWRGVRIELGMLTWHWSANCHASRDQRERAAMDKARVVLHAPAIGHLSWDWQCPGPHINRPQAIALSAVRRTRAAIGEVYLGGVSFMAEPAWAVICGLLWRNRNHITALTMEMPDEFEDFEDELDEDCAPTEVTDSAEADACSQEYEKCDVVAAWADEDGYCRNLLEVLVQLRRLERLTLDCNPGVSYAAELRVEGELLPALRYLDLVDGAQHDLMLDLVRGTAARLRHLRLPDEFKLGFLFAREGRTLPSLPPALVGSVSGCVQLRSLAANIMHVACVLTMPHLRRLELWLSHQEVLPQDVAHRVRLLAQHGESLAGLRHLSLVYKGRSSEEPQWHAARASVATLLLAVAGAARNVTDADIILGGALADEVVNELLGCMPRLETVRFWEASEDNVGALTALPNLRRVTGFAKQGSAAAIVASLRAARSDLELDIH